jgi:hypothetical protein
MGAAAFLLKAGSSGISWPGAAEQLMAERKVPFAFLARMREAAFERRCFRHLRKELHAIHGSTPDAKAVPWTGAFETEPRNGPLPADLMASQNWHIVINTETCFISLDRAGGIPC